MSACTALSTLLSSDALFGPANSNSSNHSAALGMGLNQLSSGNLVNRYATLTLSPPLPILTLHKRSNIVGCTLSRYAGMPAIKTSCPGLLISAQKLSSSDTNGASISAGATTFRLPISFAAVASVAAGDTIQTSSQVFGSNPHRGSSNSRINSNVTSLSLMVTTADDAARYIACI